MRAYVPNQIVKRREEHLGEIRTVFPAEDPINLSPQALTDSADFIATDIVWSELLPKLTYFVAPFVLAFTLEGPVKSSLLTLLRAPQVSLGTWTVILLEVVLLILWLRFLRWAETCGVDWGTTTVLGIVIPAGGCFLPVLLVDIGVWRAHWLLRSAVGGSFLLTITLWILLVSGLLASTFYARIKSQQRRRDPRGHFLVALFYALRGVIALKEKQRWANPAARKLLVANLEDAAKCLEFIPKTIPGLDRFSSKWNRQEYLRRASGIRDLKKWVLLPKAETRSCLEKELRRILQLTAVGDWDGLPQADLPKDVPVPWWHQALMIIRSLILAAVLPIGVTVFGKYLPQEFKAPVTDAAWLFAFISLLAMLDPRFGEKLSAFKGLLSYLPFGGKSKE